MTAYIMVKFNRTNPTYQRVLVRDGEFYHSQLFRWLALPEEWERKAQKALRAAEIVCDECRDNELDLDTPLDVGALTRECAGN